VTTFAFETITPEEALNIQAGDYLTFARGPASQVAIAYSPQDLPIPARIEVAFEGRTVVFGPELAELSQRGALDMGDHSRLKIGDEGREVLTGFDTSDGLYGGAGDDILYGEAGNDLLQGNAGNDTLHGGAGANTLYGGRGDDLINASSYGETHGSWAHGNRGDDEVIGGAGNDTLYGGQGDDFIAGKEGHDVLRGDLGDDEILTGAGDDLAYGGAGDDKLTSSDGSDMLFGGDGNDLVVAYGRGLAWMEGGAGNDTIVTATSDQALVSGGEGRDRFEFVARTAPHQGTEHIVADWESGDQLHFAEVRIYSILPRSYSEFVADDYAQALSIANQHIMFTGAHYVSAQVGRDVLVFANTNGDSGDGADIAVMLVGKTLADISLANFL
jgi:Ca2+-binding RTX toxin-like protein